MRKLFFLASVFLFLFFLIPFSFADSSKDWKGFGPLGTRTQNPLYLLFLGSTPESPDVLENRHWKFRVHTTFTNLIEQASSDQGLALDLDMEMVRTAFQFSYGFYPNFEVGIEIPFLNFSGGFLDSFIQSYHHTLHVSNGGREQLSNGRFGYRVSKSGTTLYSVSPVDFGLSDIPLYLKYRIFEEKGARPALALRTSFKIPTGDREKGLGSGAPDFHFNLSLEKSYGRFHSDTNVGYLVLGGFEPMQSYLNSVAITFSQSFEVQMTHIASVVAQIQGNSPLFHGAGFRRLDGVPIDLNIGFQGTGPRGGSWEHFRWEFAFGEDMIPSGPSVDFNVHLSLGAEF